jgi:hypothetical protein
VLISKPVEVLCRRVEGQPVVRLVVSEPDRKDLRARARGHEQVAVAGDKQRVVGVSREQFCFEPGRSERQRRGRSGVDGEVAVAVDRGLPHFKERVEVGKFEPATEAALQVTGLAIVKNRTEHARDAQ